MARDGVEAGGTYRVLAASIVRSWEGRFVDSTTGRTGVGGPQCEDGKSVSSETEWLSMTQRRWCELWASGKVVGNRNRPEIVKRSLRGE